MAWFYVRTERILGQAMRVSSIVDMNGWPITRAQLNVLAFAERELFGYHMYGHVPTVTHIRS